MPVLIDFDGTLANSLELCYSSLSKVLSQLGLRLPRKYFEKKLFGLSDRVVLSAFAKVKGKALEQLLNQKREAYIAGLPRLKLYPGAKAFLDWIKSRTKVALVTSLSQTEADAALAATSLQDRFDAVVCGDKRKRTLYAMAAARLGSRAARCIVIEDSATGLQAAKAAGMRALLIARPWNRGVLPRFQNWLELKAKLKTLRNF